MISNSTTSYVLIRVAICSLRLIAPLSIAYTLARITILNPSPVPLPLEIIAYAESIFYFVVYLPRRYVLQRPARQGSTMSQQERKEIFAKSLESIPDMDHFLSVWFKGADTRDLKRDEVEEWLAWGFFNQDNSSACDQEELEEYVVAIEQALKKPLPPGRGPLKSMRPTLDPIHIQHRSLLYYLVSNTSGWDFCLYCSNFVQHTNHF
jgi:hypothetical protein